MAAKTKGTTRADRAKSNGKATEEKRSGVRITYDDGQEIILDLNSLTVGEQVELEEWLGQPMAQAWDTGWIFSSKASAKLAQIARSRREPTFTLSDVLAATKLELEFAVVPPTTPETDGSQD